jgi:hypothetical protein
MAIQPDLVGRLELDLITRHRNALSAADENVAFSRRWFQVVGLVAAGLSGIGAYPSRAEAVGIDHIDFDNVVLSQGTGHHVTTPPAPPALSTLARSGQWRDPGNRASGRFCPPPGRAVLTLGSGHSVIRSR